MIFCLKIEEFLLFLTCCFKFTTNHESKFASTCKICFPNTCKRVLCSGNQFPVKIHIFLFFNFVQGSLHGIALQINHKRRRKYLLRGRGASFVPRLPSRWRKTSEGEADPRNNAPGRARGTSWAAGGSYTGSTI